MKVKVVRKKAQPPSAQDEKHGPTDQTPCQSFQITQSQDAYSQFKKLKRPVPKPIKVEFELQPSEPQQVQLQEIRNLKQQLLEVTKSLTLIKEQHRTFEMARQQAENLISNAIQDIQTKRTSSKSTNTLPEQTLKRKQEPSIKRTRLQDLTNTLQKQYYMPPPVDATESRLKPASFKYQSRHLQNLANPYYLMALSDLN